MARDHKPVPGSVDQAILRRLEKLENEVRTLRSGTTTTLQVYPDLDQIADPIEGEIVIAEGAGGGAALAGHEVYNEGVALPYNSKLDFVGHGVHASDRVDGSATRIKVKPIYLLRSTNPTARNDFGGYNLEYNTFNIAIPASELHAWNDFGDSVTEFEFLPILRAKLLGQMINTSGTTRTMNFRAYINNALIGLVSGTVPTGGTYDFDLEVTLAVSDYNTYEQQGSIRLFYEPSNGFSFASAKTFENTEQAATFKITIEATGSATPSWRYTSG